MIGYRLTWLVPVAFCLVGFGSSVQSAMAQTTYPFEATYNSENTLVPITENVSRVTITGQSTDAPYGLTSTRLTDYGLTDLATGTITFGPDAAEFGLQNLPSGNLTYFGLGSDQLFGTNTGTAKLDFQNLVGTATGTVNITGGSGRFSGATGIFSFVENDILNQDQTAPFKGQLVLSGSFQTPQAVPESRNITALVSMGVIGVGFGLRRRSFRVAG